MKHLALAVLLACLASPAEAGHHKHYADVNPGISCPHDRVVWVNTNSRIYHYEGERWFGRTEYGQFECEKAARAEGDRATRNGQ